MKISNIFITDHIDYFIDRICKENCWDRNYAIRVINEYKKFIFLSTLESVAPSFEIDQVWHAHLLFSKDYEIMCENIGKRIYHNPDVNPKKNINIDQYDKTKKLYFEIFKHSPPNDIWTNWKKLEYVYVDLKDNIILPRNKKNLIRLLLKFIFNV